MIGNWKILAAVPFAIAIGACSSHNNSNVDTAAGSLSPDTATSVAPAPSTPMPGADTGMVLDTTKKKSDSTHADSLKKDSTHKATTHKSAKHKAKKAYTTKKP